MTLRLYHDVTKKRKVWNKLDSSKNHNETFNFGRTVKEGWGVNSFLISASPLKEICIEWCKSFPGNEMKSAVRENWVKSVLKSMCNNLRKSMPFEHLDSSFQEPWKDNIRDWERCIWGQEGGLDLELSQLSLDTQSFQSMLGSVNYATIKMNLRA